MKSEEIIITVDGTEEVRSNCRRIKGKYYRIGDPKVMGSGQCYKVNGLYRREETGYIQYNYSLGEYVVAKNDLVKGVVAINEEELVLGHFDLPQEPIRLYDSNNKEYILMNEDLVKDSRVYRYYIQGDAYYHTSLMPASKFNKLKMLDQRYKQSLDYDCRGIMHNYIQAYKDNDLVIGDKVKKVAPLLKGLSFGIEFETVGGQIPERFTKPLGLIPLRDGSVQGLEYATIPYEGEKGLQAAMESCNILSKFTKYDENCSLHLHIGNVPRTEEFFLALFKTLCLVQDEVFELFPLYKKYNFGVKKKNYTQPFQAARLLSKMDSKIDDNNIKENFGVLYEFLSAGQRYSDVDNDLENVVSHPSDPRGDRKWNIKSRYYWVNLIPLLFGNKATIEFRIHTPTTDMDKVLYYLIMCTSIISYVKNNTKAILTKKDTSYGSLSNIFMSELRGDNNGMVDYMISYINSRRRHMLSNHSVGDIKGNETKVSVPRFNLIKGYSPKSAKSENYGGLNGLEQALNRGWR